MNSIVDDLQEHDVVEYSTDDGRLGLGVVCEDGTIHPLCYFVEEEDGPVDYVWDEEVDAVAPARLRRVAELRRHRGRDVAIDLAAEQIPEGT